MRLASVALIRASAVLRRDHLPAPATPGPPLDLIEERIVEAALAKPCSLSLGSGMAGVMLMAARMAQLQPSRVRAARVARLAGAIAGSIGNCTMQAGLWSGLAGVLYAMEYVRRVDPMLLGAQREAIGDFVDEMDDVLASALLRPARRARFDLIEGHCGIGVYALMRRRTSAARRLFAAAEQALLDTAEREGGHCAWRGPPDSQAQHEFDLGVAHGTPGVIGLLAHGLRLGLGTRYTAALLDDSLRWLKEQQDTSLPHSRFASFTGMRGQSSRLAWCYGDLGVAAVVAAAAQACRGATLDQWWRALARDRIEQPAASWKLAEDTMCHGRAGVLHVLRRLLARGLQSQRAEALAGELETALAQSAAAAGTFGNVGLINGWSGVLLALAESGRRGRAARRPWHLCMLTPA
jgi:hypothetical protein